MAPKRQTQLLREKRSKKQERRLPQEPQTWDEESQDSWESQAATTEEEEDWEESLGETEEEAEGTDEEPAEEETPNAAAPLRSGAGSKTPRTPPAPPKLPPKKASRRWDAKPASAPAASVGKMMAGQRRQRGAYCSWRAYKNDILACLLHCGGNVSFTRRYLLFHHGVAVPRNVLHYYRHLYSPFHQQQQQFPETSRENGESDLRAPGHAADAGAENAHFSHAVRHISAEPRAATRTEN
ncbi:22K protein [Simian adenovirus A1258]|uniref:22K protein n=1 Tax=Simian adenovirus A1258 TaxID=1159189 RepID=H9AAI9_9ADEN|nr:22K protein [Simian adenovirus A1258]